MPKSNPISRRFGYAFPKQFAAASDTFRTSGNRYMEGGTFDWRMAVRIGNTLPLLLATLVTTYPAPATFATQPVIIHGDFLFTRWSITRTSNGFPSILPKGIRGWSK